MATSASTSAGIPTLRRAAGRAKPRRIVRSWRLTQSRAASPHSTPGLPRARADRAGRDGVLGPLLDGARCTFCVRSGVPVAVVNPLAARYLRKAGSNAPSPIRPMPGASPRWPMRDSPPARDPLAGVELRQSARFAMTLRYRTGEGLPEAVSPRRACFPELRELFEDPTCRTARAVLRLAPTASAATRRRTFDSG